MILCIPRFLTITSWIWICPPYGKLRRMTTLSPSWRLQNLTSLLAFFLKSDTDQQKAVKNIFFSNFFMRVVTYGTILKLLTSYLILWLRPNFGWCHSLGKDISNGIQNTFPYALFCYRRTRYENKYMETSKLTKNCLEFGQFGSKLIKGLFLVLIF